MLASSPSSSARSATFCCCCLSGLGHTPKRTPTTLLLHPIRYPHCYLTTFVSLSAPLCACCVAAVRSLYLIASVAFTFLATVSSLPHYITTTRSFYINSRISSPFSLFIVASLFLPPPPLRLSVTLSSGYLPSIESNKRKLYYISIPFFNSDLISPPPVQLKNSFLRFLIFLC